MYLFPDFTFSCFQCVMRSYQIWVANTMQTQTTVSQICEKIKSLIHELQAWSSHVSDRNLVSHCKSMLKTQNIPPCLTFHITVQVRLRGFLFCRQKLKEIKYSNGSCNFCNTDSSYCCLRTYQIQTIPAQPAFRITTKFRILAFILFTKPEITC